LIAAEGSEPKPASPSDLWKNGGIQKFPEERRKLRVNGELNYEEENNDK
jgi:hypothetical protein